MAGANEAHAAPQRRQHMISAQHYHGQSNAGLVSSQECALTHPQERCLNYGRMGSKAAALHAATTLPARQTASWSPRGTTLRQAGEGPLLQTMGFNTDCETPTAVPKLQT